MGVSHSVDVFHSSPIYLFLSHEGIIFEEGPISASLTLRNYHAPRQHSSYYYGSEKILFVVTPLRFFAVPFGCEFALLLNIPWSSPHLSNVELRVKQRRNGSSLKVSTEISYFANNPGERGQVTMNISTQYAQQLFNIFEQHSRTPPRRENKENTDIYPPSIWISGVGSVRFSVPVLPTCSESTQAGNDTLTKVTEPSCNFPSTQNSFSASSSLSTVSTIAGNSVSKEQSKVDSNANPNYSSLEHGSVRFSSKKMEDLPIRQERIVAHERDVLVTMNTENFQPRHRIMLNRLRNTTDICNVYVTAIKLLVLRISDGSPVVHCPLPFENGVDVRLNQDGTLEIVNDFNVHGGRQQSLKGSGELIVKIKCKESLSREILSRK